VQQARTYAEMLNLKFAYATNGHDIIEIDYFTGKETQVSDYATPAELWTRYQAGQGLAKPDIGERLLTPFNHTVGKDERYYQQTAINRTVEAILKGNDRLLLTMATGTGKTFVAFQICWKLWSSRWNRTGEHRHPRILYLADRNILVDQPKDGLFAAFGDARYKIESGEVVQSREMYFAIYQALAEDERRLGLFKSFAADFFDLIIVDECHRGCQSAPKYCRPNDIQCVNPSLAFRVETFTLTESFKPGKAYRTRIKWRDANGNEQSRLLVTEPETVVAELSQRGADRTAGAKRSPRRPARTRKQSRSAESGRNP
jgi:type I site-specific restriction endonuclease